MPVKTYTMDEAIDFIRELHDNSSSRPYVVGVWGAGQHVGKTEFCKSAMNKLHVPRRLDCVCLTQGKIFTDLSGLNLEYVFYQNEENWFIPPKSMIEQTKSRIFKDVGKGMDKGVFIFNPTFKEKHADEQLSYLSRTFDILVRNSDSTLK